jgi:hypothetical protein
MTTTSEDLWGPAISIKVFTALSSNRQGMYIAPQKDDWCSVAHEDGLCVSVNTAYNNPVCTILILM